MNPVRLVLLMLRERSRPCKAFFLSHFQATGNDYCKLLALCLVVLARVLHRGRHRLRTDEGFMRTYGSLYLRYEDRCYYWELVVLARKLLMVAIALALSRQPEAQVASTAALRYQRRRTYVQSSRRDARKGRYWYARGCDETRVTDARITVAS